MEKLKQEGKLEQHIRKEEIKKDRQQDVKLAKIMNKQRSMQTKQRSNN